MVKHHLMNRVRQAGLIKAFDWLYFQWNRIRFYRRNAAYRKQHPHISLPPAYMLYESYRLDYAAYISDGNNTAVWLKKHLSKHTSATGIRIMEWGCGPARIVRHVPEVFEKSHVFASDYNADTILWCKKHISNVEFSINQLHPPLTHAGDYFDVIYALSVFTHLSEKHHYDWLAELHRLLKVEGVLLITTQGEGFITRLSVNEIEQFKKGQVVVREGMIEGHRSYSAFQPESFMYKLFSPGWEVLEWIKGKRQDWGIEQDTWIVRKKLLPATFQQHRN